MEGGGGGGSGSGSGMEWEWEWDGSGTRWEWDEVGVGRGGSGTRWEWDEVGVGRGGSGTRWEWDEVGLNKGLERDWSSVGSGLGHGFGIGGCCCWVGVKDKPLRGKVTVEVVYKMGLGGRWVTWDGDWVWHTIKSESVNTSSSTGFKFN